MLTHRYTITPLLLALAIGIASMPTNIFQFCSRNLGTLEIEPWRVKSMASAVRARAASIAGLVRAFFASAQGRQSAAIAATLIVALVLSAHPHAGDGSFATFAALGSVSQLKTLRQRASDLQTELKAAKAERAAIGNDAIAQNRAMTPDERTKFAEGATKISSIEARIEETNELLQAAETANEALRSAPVAANGDDEASTRAARGASISVRDNAQDDPKRGFKSHTEYLTKVMEANRFGRVDERLKPLAAVGSDEHGTHSDPSAAFLIPAGFSPDILSIQAEGDPTATLTRKMPMTSPSVKVNARNDKDHTTSVSGGLVVYRHSETNAITPSKMATEQLTFNAEDLVGAAYATENQISDSPISFLTLIADGFRDEFARKILREKVRGTGSGGQFLGVLNSPALVTVDAEDGQPADTIVKENIDKMEARLWGPDASDRVVYLANKTTLPQLSSLVQVVGTGGNSVPYLTTGPDGVRRLNGRRIYFTEVCGALGALGDLILVNWAEYIEATYQTLQQAESIHTRFLNNERTFKFWVRNAGMPWWRVPLTPENGETLSPIVTLAAR